MVQGALWLSSDGSRVGSVTYPTLEHVAMEARPYPVEALEGCETGLVLFAAAFLGHNDAIHFAEAGIITTCVDRDGPRLREMQALYPESWSFVEADVFAFVRASSEKFDVVSADPFTPEFPRVAKLVPALCRLANRSVIVGAGTATVDEIKAPRGWLVGDEKLHRSSHLGGVYWVTLERT